MFRKHFFHRPVERASPDAGVALFADLRGRAGRCARPTCFMAETISTGTCGQNWSTSLKLFFQRGLFLAAHKVNLVHQNHEGRLALVQKIDKPLLVLRGHALERVFIERYTALSSAVIGLERGD